MIKYICDNCKKEASEPDLYELKGLKSTDIYNDKMINHFCSFNCLISFINKGIENAETIR